MQHSPIRYLLAGDSGLKPFTLLALALLAPACGKGPTTPAEPPHADPEFIPGVSGPYLGQTPPGRTLQRFALGIIPPWFHAEVTISPDGQEVFWAEQGGIRFSRQVNGRWTTPQRASFSQPSSVLRYDDVPVVAPDNRRLFFLSQRPIGYASPNDENIWYVERTTAGWSEPVPLPQVVNSVPEIHWQVSVANNGTVYFSGSDKIYVSRYANGTYGAPEPLEAINAFGRVICPFIAPDESFLIFTRLHQFVGTLYISFRNANGQWLEPQALSGIPGPTSFVSRDGRYLFAAHHWISASVLDDLRPTS